MRTLIALTFILTLSACAVIQVPASSCGWVTDAVGHRTWTCPVTAQPMLGYTEE